MLGNLCYFNQKKRRLLDAFPLKNPYLEVKFRAYNDFLAR